ncbi:hypothetical protein DRL80_01085 [Salmonella enterica subsp. enterica]|uniref:Uncharacterized protein n=2 Tax=Salmonella enterica TaxID=28901 RepID=A0A756BT73_SALER|nr:hypothetical protein [Salmonella enterica]EBN0301185.1 hypothetical protein [Salmonella enterica subsp. enterica serovar Newport]EBV0829982.1 hypothetical protein [Salmonella enterica subsp. enterica serovar Bredeney]EBZ9514772.1 hypothetical protein [Salmonella enterica subsp. enterica serovar Eastbourne]ECC3445420.1 hypothetical protein [Salmonella enterica subsp. enterica]EDG5039804.1 hypothetical protein [Salmonella enterica subsp. enterica serovar Bovismorbificans]EIF5169857.1 hypothe
MAMNKKEKEQLENAIRLMAVNRALRWSDYGADRDVGVPHGTNQYVNGWSINIYSCRVYKSWSSTVTHGYGWVENEEIPRSASQRGIAQYSTEEKALKALRHCMEMKFAEALYEIDKQILAINEE